MIDTMAVRSRVWTTAPRRVGATVQSRVREGFAAVDPLLVACCLVAFVVYLMHGFNGLLTTDQGVYAYSGQQVAQGVPPYVAIANRVGPLAHLIPGGAAFVARVVGVDELLAMRVLFMLISVAAVGVAYLVGRDVFRSRLAGVASAAALLSMHGFIDMATYGPREKTPLVLFILATLLALTHRKWLTSGVLVSLATLTWQPAFIPLIGAVLIAVLLGVPRRTWWRALARVAIGGLVPALVTVGSYAAIGRLQLFLDCFVLINAKYTYGTQSSLLDRTDVKWDRLSTIYGASLWVILIGLAALLVTAAIAAARRGRREPHSVALIACGLGGLISVVWTVRAFDGWPDSFPVLPFAAVGIGSLVGVVVERAPGRVALVTTLVLSAACTATAVGYSVGNSDDRLLKQRSETATVMRVLPEARIVSVRAPQALVLSHQRQPFRYQLFANGMTRYIQANEPGGIRGYSRRVATYAPTVLALDGVPKWLKSTIQRSYVEVGGDGPGWTWFVRRDVGGEKVRELDEALTARTGQDGGHDRTTG